MQFPEDAKLIENHGIVDGEDMALVRYFMDVDDDNLHIP